MSKRQEFKEVTKTYYDYELISVTCDGCGKEHKIEDDKLPEDWYEFSGHHTDWGNDSIESYEYYHCCSPECYPTAFNKCVDSFKAHRSSEIDGKPILFAKKMVIYFESLTNKKEDK